MAEPPVAAPPVAVPLAPPVQIAAASEPAESAGRLQALRECPPFLVSLVLHFVILTGLAQIFIPETRLPNLIVLMSAQSADPDVQELVISAPAILAPLEIDSDQASTEDALFAPAPQQRLEEDLQVLPPQDALANKEPAAEIVKESSQPAAPQANIAEEIEESTANAQEAAAAAQAIVAARRAAELAAQEIDPVAATAADHALAKAALSGKLDFKANDEQEQIVYHFILWDIGKLNNDTAPRARQDFNSLEIDALPALVRGLNASAYIHASCPVGVLSQKVETLITQSKNPEALRYALVNIGRGVPATAPHASRLAEMKKRLEQSVDRATRDRVRLAVEADLHQGERANYIKQLRRASIDKVTGALGSDDPDLRWAAAHTIAERRLTVPIPLTSLLNDENEDVRRRAHLALVDLAGGTTDLGFDQEKWKSWWVNRRTARAPKRDPIEEESQARTQLARADALRKQGYPESAKESYRAIIHRLPGTDVAEVARQRIIDME